MTSRTIYKTVALTGFPMPARAAWIDGAWVAQINTQGSEFFSVRALAAPKTLESGQQAAAEQVAQDGRVAGYVTAASYGRARAALAALGAPEVDLQATRRALVLAYNLVREADYQDRHDAVEQALNTGRAARAADRTGEIETARQALEAFDAAHSEVVAGIEADRRADVARFLAAD